MGLSASPTATIWYSGPSVARTKKRTEFVAAQETTAREGKKRAHHHNGHMKAATLGDSIELTPEEERQWAQLKEKSSDPPNNKGLPEGGCHILGAQCTAWNLSIERFQPIFAALDG